MKLNLGCGTDIQEGFVNVDRWTDEGVTYADFDSVNWRYDITHEEDVCEYALVAHTIEHLQRPLVFMDGLYRLMQPGGVVEIRVPYGSSDDAFEDPTHVRQYFHGSWGYFSQPFYWRADYGYRGDFRVRDLYLLLNPRMGYNQATDSERIIRNVANLRNVVSEMIVFLEAVKPARARDKSLQETPLIQFGIPGVEA